MTYRFAFHRYSLPFRLSVKTAYGVWPSREGMLVRLESENGRVGYGEAAPIPAFGTETIEEVEIFCVAFGSHLTDEQIAAIPAKYNCLKFALASALDALAESPMPAANPFLAVAALLPSGRAALEEVKTKGEAGFRTFKWKVGIADIAEELPLFDDLIANLPSGGRLRLDANGAWDRRRAERWLERCANRPVEFVEQPVAAHAKGADDLLCGLAEDHPTPLALDESVVSAGDVAHWLERGWTGVFVLKLSLLGEAAAVVERLERASAAVVFSSALETAVGAKAALRLAFRFRGEARALGFGVWPLFINGCFDGPHATPFLRAEDVEVIDQEAVWNALR